MQYALTDGFLIQEPARSWHLYLLLLMFVTYAIARTYLGHLSSISLMATIRYNTAVSMFNDNSQLQKQRDIVLNGFYVVSMGFFAMLALQKWNIAPYDLHDYKLFIFISMIVFLTLILKVLILRILGFIFEIQPVFSEYLYHSYSYNKLIGIVFLPVNFILVYTTNTMHDITMFFSLSIVGIMIGLKIFRGIIFSVKNDSLNFYLFLYLCALEIVPMLFLYKWFTIIV